MLLTDLEFAERLGSSYFEGLPIATTKRRLRRMVADAGITPVVKKKKEWVFKEDDIQTLVQAWDSLSAKEKDRRIGTSGGRSTASRSSRAQEFLTPINPVHPK